MDINLFLDILGIDSTSGRERPLADFLAKTLPDGLCTVTMVPADATSDTPVNLLLAWGDPRIVYCTHLDTVPPYIPPVVEENPDGTRLLGRGTCDAKGQIMAMYTACRRLAAQGHSGFGLLLLHGEETGSYGAKQYRELPGGDVVIVGEPTGNRMVTASKGTKAFAVEITGKAFHSGYPEHGVSAVDRFVDLVCALRRTPWPLDAELGPTTWNIGALESPNPQNILSPRLTCRIYFRTTFASDAMVGETMQSLASEDIQITALGGDTPTRYLTLPGFETCTVAFGSDAPQLTNFPQKILCGPGSILVAHRPDEQITLAEISDAADNYVRMYHLINKNSFGP